MVEDLPMIIPGQFGFNYISGFREEAFWNIFPIGSNVKLSSARNDHWKILYKVWVFYADRKSKMATTAGHRLTLHPMRKCSNAFFSETTNMIKAKLYMNVHWMVLYKLNVFCSYKKFKMAATAGLSLTLNPMVHVQFGFNNICSFWEEGIWTFSHRGQC
jgi:hypothetical protein